MELVTNKGRIAFIGQLEFQQAMILLIPPTSAILQMGLAHIVTSVLTLVQYNHLSIFYQNVRLLAH